MIADESNAAQVQAWNGDEGEHWTEHEEHYNRAGRGIAPAMWKAAEIQAADRVLDVGCGCGESTREAARRAMAGSVLGVDLSAPMIQRARQRAADEGLTNVAFEQADAQVHPFAAETFDVVISRFGAMFFGDPEAAFRNIAAALRPGGRIALLAWQPLAENEWLQEIRGALAMGRSLPEPPAEAPGPFGLARPERVHRILTAAGFAEVSLEPVREPMWLGADADDALGFLRHTMVRWFTADLDEATAAEAVDRLRAAFATRETPEGVLMGSAAWVITGRRKAPRMPR